MLNSFFNNLFTYDLKHKKHFFNLHETMGGGGV